MYACVLVCVWVCVTLCVFLWSSGRPREREREKEGRRKYLDEEERWTRVGKGGGGIGREGRLTKWETYKVGSLLFVPLLSNKT